MARQTQGRIFKRGKKGYYYLQYYLNGKQIVKSLRDENDKPITGQRVAQKAADVILAPYKANDNVQRRQQAVDALKSAQDRVIDAERIKNAIKLTDAFKSAMQKPRKKEISNHSMRVKQNHWDDFTAYMDKNYPAITTIDNVKKIHAEKYTQYLIKHGKFKKEISFKRNNIISTFTPASTKLSSRTINGYIVSVNEIFNLLREDVGMEKSPFSDIPKQKLIQDNREAFTMDELKLIAKDGDDFILPLFTVGLCTGLREADICLLEWGEVFMDKNIIIRTTRKTGKEVMIPIMPPLKAFLENQYNKFSIDKYVLPEHADMYLNNPSGITWRVKRKLEQLKIETTKIPKGRSRAVSIKDVHSLRHSFCYYAGLYNVPLAIVQAVVGHMSPEMTKHYTMHATSNDIKKAFKNMPDLFGVLDVTSEIKLIEENEFEPERQELHDLVDTLAIDEIKKLLLLLKSE